VAGLSLITGMPASSAASAMGRCRWLGVTMTTKSIASGRFRSAFDHLPVVRIGARGIDPKTLARRPRALRRLRKSSRHHLDLSVHLRGHRCTGPMNAPGPPPTMPMRNLRSLPSLPFPILQSNPRVPTTETLPREGPEAPKSSNSRPTVVVRTSSCRRLRLNAIDYCDTMNTLLIPDSSRRWDCLSLGEVMLRLDPGEGRIHTTRQFQVWEGGGEYNVARGLRRCFGLRTAIATALADNPVGRLVEDLILQGGVDTSLLKWVPYDGVGRTVRNGLNFTERGFGVRAAPAAPTAATPPSARSSPATSTGSDLRPANGSRWFHTGGIFAALSASTAEVAAEAMDARATARRSPTT
jgi:hypothetical protein